ncbi:MULTISPECIES: hypothetical protein [unclassified Pseudofrankia]|uniref:hypothetical protein n=1 Tax=unclassified Pseudofrankia TaxID=2994372 RepID=UPI001042413E|nr:MULTISPECIES: hypothetical protein [unclassified Pseudofrankia]MDT3443540.1 hypothetical protein [Pseudofrankia sp. BMG5.37]
MTMTAPSGMPVSPDGVKDLVVEIDLRDDDVRQALADCASFDEFQRDFAREQGVRSGNWGRVLLVDNPRELRRAAHVKGVRKVALARTAGSVMCLLVGPASGVPTPLGLPEPQDPDEADDRRETPETARHAGRPGRGPRPGTATPPGTGSPETAARWEAALQEERRGASATSFDPGRAGRRPGRGAPQSRRVAHSGLPDDDPENEPAVDRHSYGPSRSGDGGNPATHGRRPGRGRGAGEARNGQRPTTGAAADRRATRVDPEAEGWTEAPASWRGPGASASAADIPEPFEDRDVALRLPSIFGQRAIATLWVSDGRGVGWGLGETRPSSMTAASADFRDTSESAQLIALRDALREPSVFDRVTNLVAELPDAVAAPGLRAVSGRVDTGVLDEAQQRAIARLALSDDKTPAGGAPPAGLFPSPPLSLLLPAGPPERGLAAARSGARGPRSVRALLPDGLLGTSLRRCRDLLDDADAVVTGLRGTRALLTGRVPGQGGVDRRPVATAATLMTDAADELRQLRVNLADDFTDLDGLRGLGPAARDRLARLGVAQPPSTIDDRSVVASLRGFTHDSLDLVDPDEDTRVSLGTLARWLGGIASALFPAGSAAYVDQLDQACPDDTLTRLASPPSLGIRPAGAGLVLPVFLLCTLASLWSPVGASGTGGLAAAAVLGVLAWLLALAGARLLVVAGSLPDQRVAAGEWLALGAVGLAGVAAGCALTRFTGGPPLPGQLRPVTLLLAALGLVLWPPLVWRSAAGRWQTALSEGREAAVRLAELAEHVARFEWMLVNRRRAAHELTNAVRGAVLDIQGAIADYADELNPRVDVPPPEPVPGLETEVAVLLYQRVGEISRVVLEDLVDLVRAALTRVWTDLERRALDAPAQWLREEADWLLEVYGQHLQLRGIHEQPPFGREDHGPRQELVDAVWTGSRRVGDVLGAQVSDDDILQLNGAEDLSFLDVSAARAAVARFAPRAARGVLGRLGHEPASAVPVPADLAWTEGGQVAGVLRLVSLRPGAVRTTTAGEA